MLRTIGPGSQLLGATAASVTLFDSSTGAGGITLGALADYFDRYAAGASADTIETTSGAVQAGAVMLSKQWLGRLESEADSRAKLAAGLQQIAPKPFTTGGAQPAGQNQLPLSGSDPQCLALLQEQHRQEGQQQAAEQLDATTQELASLKQQSARLLARLELMQREKHDADNRAEQYRREAQEERRCRTITEEKLHELAGVIAFMNEDNPLSPVEGRRAVTAWCDLTDNGQTDPTDGTGIGVGELARRWWQTRFGEPKGIVMKHLQWILAWPARKKGGAVAKKSPKKG
ncbi:hypothetical protein ACSVIJ_10765 [Pseudomonas sp. NCHU5208]|uniref:hypothetical protein n=1 Tax=unclassified Pseudomonas TaxID=196821 RepID=UPI003F96ACA1